MFILDKRERNRNTLRSLPCFLITPHLWQEGGEGTGWSMGKLHVRDRSSTDEVQGCEFLPRPSPQPRTISIFSADLLCYFARVTSGVQHLIQTNEDSLLVYTVCCLSEDAVVGI